MPSETTRVPLTLTEKCDMFDLVIDIMQAYHGGNLEHIRRMLRAVNAHADLVAACETELDIELLVIKKMDDWDVSVVNKSRLSSIERVGVLTTALTKAKGDA